MANRSAEGTKRYGEGLKYALAHHAKATESLDFSCLRLGQMNPQHCPRPEDARCGVHADQLLGDPMQIREVAALMGCSVWTVRQRYLPLGLPYFRIGTTGKLIFFHHQVIRWILEKQQQKGGSIR